MGKVFIFDMGEVVILNVKNLQAIAKRFNLEYKPFRAFYGLYDKDLMEGKMEDMEFFSIMEKKYGVEIKENLFIKDFLPLFRIHSFSLSLIISERRAIDASWVPIPSLPI